MSSILLPVAYSANARRGVGRHGAPMVAARLRRPVSVTTSRVCSAPGSRPQPQPRLRCHVPRLADSGAFQPGDRSTGLRAAWQVPTTNTVRRLALTDSIVLHWSRAGRVEDAA